MKRVNFLITILVFIASCSAEHEGSTKKIKVSVIDEKTNRPVDSAQVILNTWDEINPMKADTIITNSSGQCIFSLKYETGSHYEIWAIKRGYYNYLSDDTGSTNKSLIEITEKTQSDITLYLTSDSMQNSNYWKNKAKRYNIDTLINKLRGNELFGLPLLIWEDIPKLLEISNDTIMLSNFPRNMLSSNWQKECYLGIVSLWLIESIRKTEETGKYNPFDVYPSLNPIIKEKIGYDKKSDLEKMQLASNIYNDWWQRVMNLDKKEACKIDPFKDAGVGW